MKGLFKRGPRIPEVNKPSPSDPYGSGPSDAELLAEYGGGGVSAQRSSRPQPPSDPYGAPRDPYGAPRDPYGAPRDSYGASTQRGSGMATGSQGYASGLSAYAQPSYNASQAPAYSGTGGAAPSSYLAHDPYAQTQEQQPLDPEEEEIQDLKFQIRATKQESLSSTRNALRLARETEETATNTMLKLGEQSDTIGDTERHLDIAKAHASRAEDNAREIKQLNKSILRPKIIRNKRAKRQAQEEKALQRHVEERTERELTREEVLSSQRRVDDAVNDNGPFSRLRNKFQGTQAELVDPKAQRARYQFEATQSDDELEDELDANLDDISALSARMNLLSKAMGQEVNAQNKRLERVSDKTSALDTRIYAGTQRLANLR
ncbi:Protein transport protein S9 plasma membrane t-SNARE [Malassezia brasiliensis]|uniref:Protein transport protein S9 plasma membrane t-SNARE n=1 Tax=Malassezia brasiliensis TaxID=1821822 RepID=A0AAF0DVR3_9BASI|nr:Protein transport protein S9 plasma membrane t-SNARE [Malassezia brasiliensis]